MKTKAKTNARKSKAPITQGNGTRVPPTGAQSLPTRDAQRVSAPAATPAPRRDAGSDSLVEKVKASAKAGASAKASASAKAAARATGKAAPASGAAPVAVQSGAAGAGTNPLSATAGKTIPTTQQSAEKPTSNPVAVYAGGTSGKGLPKPAPPIPVPSNPVEDVANPLKKTQPPTNCVANNDHLVRLGDAYACCRKNLLSIQKNVERLADFFAAISISNNSTRYELIQSFEDSGAIQGVPQSYQESLVMVGPGTSARMLMVARSAPGAVPALLPWFGTSADTDIEPTSPDANQVYALAVPVGFWNSPQAVLETATLALKAIAVNTRTRIDQKDCCACLSKKTLTQSSKRKQVPGPLRHRVKKSEKGS